MRIKIVFFLGAALLVANAVFAQLAGTSSLAPQAPQPPMTEKEVISELKKAGPDQLLKDLQDRGVDFEMNADIEKKLRHAKATDAIIKAVVAAGPKEREEAANAAAVASGAVRITPEENADYKALEGESDPDKAIALAEAFAQKFPKSPVLTYVYAFEARAYAMKNDVAKIVEAGEKSLALKKDNLMSLLMLTDAMPTPQYINMHQADADKQLDRATEYAQEALKAIDELKKQPTESDADFAKRKASYVTSVHSSLGTIHLQRASLGLMGLDKGELAKAEVEYKMAVADKDHPDPSCYYRLGEALRLQGKTDEAIEAFTKASQMGQGPVQQYADEQIEMLKKQKAKAAAPKQ